MSILKNIYKENILIDVINDLENECNIFNYQSFSACFNCEICDIKDDCKYFDILRIIKNIQQKHKSNKIDQNALKCIFDKQ